MPSHPGPCPSFTGQSWPSLPVTALPIPPMPSYPRRALTSRALPATPRPSDPCRDHTCRAIPRLPRRHARCRASLCVALPAVPHQPEECLAKPITPQPSRRCQPTPIRAEPGQDWTSRDKPCSAGLAMTLRENPRLATLLLHPPCLACYAVPIYVLPLQAQKCEAATCQACHAATGGYAVTRPPVGSRASRGEGPSPRQTLPTRFLLRRSPSGNCQTFRVFRYAIRRVQKINRSPRQ